jgi:REP element-mobilizing transposase RayT
MANTYTQLHIQFVFAVKYRLALIEKEWKERLHQYITGIVQRKESREQPHKFHQINSMPDHVHILIGLRPHQSISSLAWQEDFGVFSYSKTRMPIIRMKLSWKNTFAC